MKVRIEEWFLKRKQSRRRKQIKKGLLVGMKRRGDFFGSVCGRDGALHTESQSQSSNLSNGRSLPQVPPFLFSFPFFISALFSFFPSILFSYPYSSFLPPPRAFRKMKTSNRARDFHSSNPLKEKSPVRQNPLQFNPVTAAAHTSNPAKNISRPADPNANYSYYGPGPAIYQSNQPFPAALNANSHPGGKSSYVHLFNSDDSHWRRSSSGNPLHEK